MWEIFKAIEYSIVYIYPGVMSLGMYQFLAGKYFKIDRSKFLIVITMSYLYVSLYCGLSDTSVSHLDYSDKFIIFIISIATPLLAHHFEKVHKNEMDKILSMFHINATMDDTVFKYAYKTSDEEIKKHRYGIKVVIYTKDFKFKYSGMVCAYEADPECSKEFCLRKYSVVKKGRLGSEHLITASKKDGDRIYINAADIECIEINRGERGNE